MALTAQQWAEKRKNIDAVVAEDGVWVGILNGEGEPIAEIQPSDLDVGVNHLNIREGTARVPLMPREDGTHPLADLLFDEGIGQQDESTAFVPRLDRGLMLCVQGPGGIDGRMVYTVSVPKLLGTAEGITEVELNCIELLGLLNFWPCPSVPGTWGDQPYKVWKTDAGRPFRVNRVLAPTQHATIAYGHTSKGPAVTTIARVIQDSFDAVNRLNASRGWANDPHLVVEVPNVRDTSPEVLIQRADKPLWETIAPTARLAGVSITGHMWWPGDAPVNTMRGARTWSKAMGVVRVGTMGR